jgi:1-phosphatidylinositol phosphodiesterase
LLAFLTGPFTQCQEIGCTLTTQLNEGIRFFDIRLKLKKGILLAFHGPWPQLTTFQTMVSEISQFLSINPHETLIVCIQQETSLHPDFSRTVKEDMQGTIAAGKWFLENRVPTLGEVRGKAVLMSRFGGGNGPDGSVPWEVPVGWGRTEVRMGWRPNRWPNSVIEGFEWECGTTEVRTQDW